MLPFTSWGIWDQRNAVNCPQSPGSQPSASTMTLAFLRHCSDAISCAHGQARGAGRGGLQPVGEKWSECSGPDT